MLAFRHAHRAGQRLFAPSLSSSTSSSSSRVFVSMKTPLLSISRRAMSTVEIASATADESQEKEELVVHQSLATTAYDRLIINKNSGSFMMEATDAVKCQKLKRGLQDPAHKDEIMANIKKHVIELSTNSVSSYLMKAALQHASKEDLRQIALKLIERLHMLIAHKDGVFVVEQALEYCSPLERDVLVCALLSVPSELRKRLRHPINHFVIKTLVKSNHLSDLETKWIMNAIERNVVDLCKHPQASYVMQEIMQHFPVSARQRLFSELCDSNDLFSLISDAKAHYCVLSAIRSGTPAHRAAIVSAIQDGQVMKCATDTTARHVLAKIIESLSAEQTEPIVQELLDNMVRKGNDTFFEMATAQCPSYVLRSILMDGTPAQKQEILDMMAQCDLNKLSCSEFGHFLVLAVIGIEQASKEPIVAAIDLDSSAERLVDFANHEHGGLVLKKLLASQDKDGKDILARLDGHANDLLSNARGCSVLGNILVHLTKEERDSAVLDVILASPDAVQLACKSRSGINLMLSLMKTSKEQSDAVVEGVLAMSILELAHSQTGGLPLVWKVFAHLKIGLKREALVTKVMSDSRALEFAANDKDARQLIHYFQARAPDEEQEAIANALPRLKYVRGNVNKTETVKMPQIKTYERRAPFAADVDAAAPVIAKYERRAPTAAAAALAAAAAAAADAVAPVVKYERRVPTAAAVDDTAPAVPTKYASRR